MLSKFEIWLYWEVNGGGVSTDAKVSKAQNIVGNVHIASFTSIGGGGEFVMEDFSGLSWG